MYNIGDTVMYGATGVCRISGITALDGIPEAQADRKYYIINPVYQNGTIYHPTDSDKVFIRPVINRTQAEALIDSIPGIDVQAVCTGDPRALAEHYRELMRTHDCGDLLRLSMSIFAKKKLTEQKNRHFSQVDESFMKEAEKLLFEELATALEIAVDDVPEYIDNRVNRVME